MNPLLDIRGVSIAFKGLRALSDVSFTVGEGRIVALKIGRAHV